MYNWAAAAGTTYANSGYGNGWVNYPSPGWVGANYTFTGTLANAFDADTDSYVYANHYNNSQNLGRLYTINTASFEASHSLYEIHVTFAYQYVNRTRSTVHTYAIEALVDGTWTTVQSGDMGGGNGGWQTIDITELTYTKVTGVRFSMYMEADLNGNYPFNLYLYQSQFQALGENPTSISKYMGVAETAMGIINGVSRANTGKLMGVA